MEPANVNAPGPEDPIESLLAEAQPHIADDGFSLRVIAALETDRRRARFRRHAILLGGLTGLAVAAAGGAFSATAVDSQTGLDRSLTDLATIAANPAIALSAALIVASLIYVFRFQSRGTHFP